MREKICLLTFEYPPRTVGGLNTFIKGLEAGLVKRGVDVQIFLPSHGIDLEAATEVVDSFKISVNGGNLTVKARRMRGLTGRKNIVLFSSDEQSALNVKNPYPLKRKHEKVALFAKAFLTYFRRNLKDKNVLLHANDRQAGMAALLVRRRFPNVRFLFTIHLLGHEKGVDDMVPRKVLKDFGISKFIPASIIERFAYTPAKGRKKGRGGRVLSPVWTEGIIAYYADMVNTVSRSYLKYDVWPPFKSKGIPKDKFAYVYNGMNVREMTLSDLGKKRNAKSKLLRLLGLKDGIVFLNTGRQNTGQKATDALVQSVDMFLEENPRIEDVRFILLAGGRNLDRKVKNILRKLRQKHPKKVYVKRGWVDDLMPYYLAADAYIMPSRFEPFGFTQIEAMCKGAPVIGSRTGGIRDVQVDYPGIADSRFMDFRKSTGMLVSIANPYDLSERILEMYALIKKDRKIYRQLQANGMRRARLFTIKATVDGYISLYRKLLSSA
ncbi:MAG: glycogen/starch synthase [Candidatus Altiarchaeota archaeon]